MYWESLYPGAPAVASASVENAAMYVQWAFNGFNGDPDAFNYNLGQFWAAKDAAYASETQDGKNQLNRLNGTAYGLKNAKAMGRITSASPSYWDQFTAFITGGTPPNPDSDAAAAEARQAALDASKAMSDAGLPTVAAYFQDVADNQVDADVAQANTVWNNPGIVNAGGIPWWLWLAAGGAVLFLMRRR